MQSSAGMDTDDETTVICFRQEKPALFKRAKAISDRLSVLAKIHKHQALFTKITHAKCQLSDMLFKALHDLKSAPDDSLLINFTEMNLYGVFTMNDYLQFISMVRDAVEDVKDGGGELSVKLYQIVLSGKNQKLVFACTDFDHFDKLQKYASECFDARVSKSDNQITVDIPTCNDDEIMANYNKLYNFINKRGDVACCESMKQIQLITDESNLQFRQYSCGSDIAAFTMEELIALVKHIQPGVNIENLTININPITKNNQCVTNNNYDNRRCVASEWVTNNPPLKNEPTTVYYERYKADIDNNLLSPNVFGPLVKVTLGRNTTQGTGGVRKWR